MADLENIACIMYKNFLPNGRGDPAGGGANLPLTGDQTSNYIGNLGDWGMNESIRALYIHPRCKVTAWKDSGAKGVSWTFYGRSYEGGHVTNAELSRLFADRCISSIMVESDISETAWRRMCCRNEITATTDQGKCGAYWSGAPCDNYRCTGEELMGIPACKDWCKNNKIACDSLKTTYCQNNPTSSLCKCIIEPDNIKKERTDGKYSGPRQCWPTSDCQKTDLVDTLITSDLIPQDCPSIINQNQNITAINSNVIGNNMNQTATVGGTEYIPEPEPPQKSYLWLYILIFIIILIIIIVITYVLLDDDEPFKN